MFWYYLVVAVLLDLAFTAVNVPYAALTAELTQDYDERTRLSSVRMSFSIVGGVLAAFFHGIIVSQFPDRPHAGLRDQRRDLGVCHRRPVFHHLLRHPGTGFRHQCQAGRRRAGIFRRACASPSAIKRSSWSP